MKTNYLISLFAPLFFLVTTALFSGEAKPADTGDKPKDAKPAEALAPGEKPKYVFKVLEASEEGETAIKKFKLDKDIKCELFAAEPMVANIVAFSIDEKGRFYVAETFRVGEGVVDNRAHMDWLDEDTNSRSVEDRAAFQKRHFGADVIKEMGLASERIKLVEDRAGKGKADYSSVFAEGFDTILDGVGAGILARKGTVWFTNIPNLWQLKDEKGGGYATARKSLHYGYGVRNAFMGHDLHGIKMGNDGRLYYSIGDRGARVKTSDGRLIDNPDSGCVFRCNPDGTNLEIYCTGLRNPQSLAFDRYGNLFTGDNNADSGDKARWEYIVEGGDYGWRIGWQYQRTNTALGSFNSEKMWHEQNAEQPRYILPPVGLIAAGPSGNVYYPGTGMPDRYKEHFFLCDFTGGTTAKIHSFKVHPKGASFEIVDKSILIEGCLATDVCWGVNGGLYISDWVEGWTKTGKGRIYRLFEEKSVAEPIVGEVKKLLGEGFDQRSIDELVTLLNHVDLRIRQEAQFVLADKTSTDESIKAFEGVLAKKENQGARLHAMWGLEMIARKHSLPQAIEALIPMLDDSDSAIKGQAAKMLGERHCEKAADGLVKLLKDGSPRVRFHATNALGKIGKRETIPAILQMVREAEDKDPFLRHAAVMALFWINDFEAILNAAKDSSQAVRMVSLLSMRRMERSEVGMFLTDKDATIVLEAARAINDVPISGAYSELAALIDQPSYSEPLLKRVLNANFRLGTEATANALMRFAQQDAAHPTMRADALAMLGEWAKPALRDRVTNLFRPIQSGRDASHPLNVMKPVMADFLKTTIERPIPEAVRTAALNAIDKLNIPEALPMFLDVVNDGGMPGATRIAALKALVARNDPKANEAIRNAANGGDYGLRKEALAMLGKIAPEEAAPRLAEMMERQVVDGKRQGLATVVDWPGKEAEKIVANYMTALLEGKLEKELMLDVLDATAKRAKEDVKPAAPAPEVKKEEPKKEEPKVAVKDPNAKEAPKDPNAKPAAPPEPPYVRPDFKNMLEKFEFARLNGPILDQYKECLFGGDGGAGRKVFFEKAEASCIRCHKIGNKGGDVGPNLSDIGLRQKREYILESIIDPNKVIAPGFESAFVKTKDGQRLTGVVKKDDDKVLVLADGNGLITIQKDNIDTRKTGQSPMPADIFKQLTKNELRDLVEYLANQKTEPEKPKAEDSKHQ
ncbi:MAG: HEAT repeat domain-containing protein [Planctomycetota bacterium]